MVPTSIPTSTPVSSSCAGKTIKFKIGNVWANESIVWIQRGGTVLNPTASSASLPSSNSTTWPISASAQRVPPHAVVGNVSASDHTLISAWAGGALWGADLRQLGVCETLDLDGGVSLHVLCHAALEQLGDALAPVGVHGNEVHALFLSEIHDATDH